MFVDDPPNLMIESAADIDFIAFIYHMVGLVFAAWIVILFCVKILFRKELAEVLADEDFSDRQHSICGGNEMIPIILGLATQGFNVTRLWWPLAVGVGIGGNSTHPSSTVNVFIVTISEWLAKQTGKKRFRFTPGIWFKKGPPAGPIPF